VVRVVDSRGLLLASFLLLAAGCTSMPPTSGPTDGTDAMPSLPPKQVFEHEGNNAQCTDVLTGTATFQFTVDPGYTHIEVSWHASGLGMVGYEIRGPNGTVSSAADRNPGDQPCNHAHSGDVEKDPVAPGTYDVTVRNQGILGWHLLVNEVANVSAGEHHHPAR
jgi:hypothetical protein